MMTLKQRIDELIKQHGSLRAASRVLQMDAAYLFRLSSGEKSAPSEHILKKLKLRKIVIVTYEATK
jgi:hypothetical protein